MPDALKVETAEAMPSGTGRSGHNLTQAESLIDQAVKSPTGIVQAVYQEPDHASRMRSAVLRVAEKLGRKVSSTTRGVTLYVQVEQSGNGKRQ